MGHSRTPSKASLPRSATDSCNTLLAPCAHVHAHTCIHARTHAHTHARTHAHARTHMHARAHITTQDLIILCQDQPMAKVLKLLLEKLPRHAAQKFLTEHVNKPIRGGDKQIIGKDRITYLRAVKGCECRECGEVEDCCLLSVAESFLLPHPRPPSPEL